MGKQRFKTIKLFLKLMLLFQIYSHHKFEAEATQNPILKNCDECDGTAGLNNPISDNETLNSVLNRPKRPARLLPLKMILGKEKNKTDIENVANRRFYGPATSCEELLKIGYTRNGFYLIKGIATSNNNQNVEIVDCLFEHSYRIKEVKEKRLGPVSMKTKEMPQSYQLIASVKTLFDSSVESASEIDLERSKRPARLLSYHLLHGIEKNDTGEEQNLPKQFYGPPSNCADLAKLGYTLNGYYLVHGSKITNNIQVALCQFQFPPGVNETAMEEKLGVVNLDPPEPSNKEFKTILIRKIRPVRLLPPRRQFEKGENKTTAKNVKRINSNPADCNGIGMLGYTLNGYYLVNGSDNAKPKRFGVLFCQFKLPPGSIKSTNEEVFGFINLLDQTKDQTSNEIKSAPYSNKIVFGYPIG